MRAPRIGTVLAAASLLASCGTGPDPVAPDDRSRLDGRVFTIGSGNSQTLSSSPDSAASRGGIFTIGSGN